MRRKILSFRRSSGFTLVEVMVTVAILAFGIVTVYEALFVSIDTFGFYTNYLDVQDWIDEKISEVQSQLITAQELEDGNTSGQVVRDQKTYDWSMAVTPVDQKESLYRVDIILSWKQGSKSVKVERSAYLLPPQLKEYAEENFLL